MNLDPSRGLSTLWTYVGFFFTVVRSVHFVDMNLDPSRGSSTLWTYVGFFDPSRVRPLCGHES